eukprot:1156318-Pelagomonas_calceolata.AAC.12
MSATINFEAYSYYFGGCPVIKVPGRLYPIELEYCPPPKSEEEERGRGRGRSKQQQEGPTAAPAGPPAGEGMERQGKLCRQ